MKKLMIVILIVVISLSGCISNSQQNDTVERIENQVEDQELRKVELSIEGLWCESCVYGIKSVFDQTEGIESLDITITDYAKQTGVAEVVYDPDKITKESISQLTEPYPSSIIKDILIR